MRFASKIMGKPIGLALAAALIGGAPALPAPAAAQSRAQAPANQVTLSTGQGTLVDLPGAMTDLFVASDAIADVSVRSPNQIYIFGKAPGETTVYATASNGRVLYSATVRVGANLGGVGQMLKMAMPDAQIVATPMNGLLLLTGTVASPDDAAEAERLAAAFTGGIQVVSRLRTATPLQVNLQVRIAEVNRELFKQIGFNILTRDNDGLFGNGFLFNLFQGGRNPGSITSGVSTVINPATGLPFPTTNFTFNQPPAGTTGIGAAGRLLGVDVLGALDLAENDGFVTTLANPNLTALSGETASFLAGGEIPIPVAQDEGQIAIEYKEFGVSLAFTPTVLADGRISMRVRPEVSQLSNAGAVTLNGFSVPALTTRRAETTVELGSGQSFMIGGLINNTHNNSLEKAPFLGDLPVLGALFRSKRFRRTESELVIVVTPYLVKPVSANQIALPTDGYRSPNDAEAFLLGQNFTGRSGEKRPGPIAAPPRSVAPGPRKPGAAAAPGFSFQ